MIKPAPSLWRTLSRGTKGQDVAAWQAANRAEAMPNNWPSKWPLVVDGDFGPNTEAATRVFQQRRAIQVTGVVDIGTRALLDPTLFIDPAPPAPPDGLPPIAFIQARDYRIASRSIIDNIVIHSAEIGEFHSSAEALGAAFKHGMLKPASSHYGVDDDTIVQYVKDKDIAFHAPGVNPISIGIEQAGYAKQTRNEWLDPYGQRMIALVAKLVAEKAKVFSIPLVWLTPEDLVAKKRGLCQHRDVTAAFHLSDHTDCGLSYPKDVLLDLATKAGV